MPPNRLRGLTSWLSRAISPETFPEGIHPHSHQTLPVGLTLLITVLLNFLRAQYGTRAILSSFNSPAFRLVLVRITRSESSIVLRLQCLCNHD